MTNVARQIVGGLLAILAAASHLQSQEKAQDTAQLLADFDRLQSAASNALPEAKAALLLQASDAFLRLPLGSERNKRLVQGALAALHSERTQIALEIPSKPDESIEESQPELLLIHLQALARLGRLLDFERLAQQQANQHPQAVESALRQEERYLLPLAAQALRTADQSSGRALFEALAKLKPVQSYRVANLGLCLRQIGEIDAAFETYEYGLKLAPQDLELWNDYGLLLRATGQRQQALKAFRQSVAIDLQRDEPLRGQGPAITNLIHAESMHPKKNGSDPMATARIALKKRPGATLLRRLTLDVTLDSLCNGATTKNRAVVDRPIGR